MTCKELVRELEAIMKAHSEAKEAEIWAYIHGEYGSMDHFHIKYVGYDKHFKPARIKLGE